MFKAKAFRSQGEYIDFARFSEKAAIIHDNQKKSA
jgi:hypothetical protein